MEFLTLILGWALENPDRLAELALSILAVFKLDVVVKKYFADKKLFEIFDTAYYYVEQGYRTGIIKKGQKQVEAVKLLEDKLKAAFGRPPTAEEVKLAEAHWTKTHEKESKLAVPRTGE